MITIIIPTTRPKLLERCIAAIRENAGIHPSQYEIWAKSDDKRIGCPSMVSQMTKKAEGNLICFVGDDCIPQKDFLKNALRAMDSFEDGFGVVAFNNLFNGKSKSRIAGHFLADKRMLPLLGGDFFHPGYRHSFCDNELTDRAFALGRFLWVEDARIENPHPMYDKDVPTDDVYKAVYNKDTFEHDKMLYLKRKIERIGKPKLGIGMPIGSRKCDNQFWLSFLGMDKPDYTLFVPRLEIYEFANDIAAIRNDLVDQAMAEGCTHLLMLDTDQIYQQDTIMKMLSHDKDVVAAPVHRRYPPFSCVALRGEIDKYISIPEEEMYSGNLVEIDATGTGCILFKTDVFFETQKPWFEIKNSPVSGKVIGEDIGFCSKIRKTGKKIFMDTSIEIGHLATMVINRSVYELNKLTEKK